MYTVDEQDAIYVIIKTQFNLLRNGWLILSLSCLIALEEEPQLHRNMKIMNSCRRYYYSFAVSRLDEC